MKRLKALGYHALAWAVITVFLIIGTYRMMNRQTQALWFDNLADVPRQNVGLVLGTGKFLKNGRVNLYYQARINAAAEVFHAGKVCYLLLSGANHSPNANEPQQMLEDLVKKGVPRERMFQDGAGWRTLDSIVRAETVFQQTQYLIISQKFHNQRALWLAKKHGHRAIAYNAQDPLWKRQRLKIEARELLARPKALFDIITQPNPQPYGKPTPIPPCPQS